METVSLGTSKIKAIASKNFFKTIPKSLSFQDLKKLPLIFRENGSYTREILVSDALEKKIELSPVIEVTGREAFMS